MAEIPNDIVLDILSRLPLKELFRFKLVCKIWSNMVVSPALTALRLINIDSRCPDSILLLRATNRIPTVTSMLNISDDLSRLIMNSVAKYTFDLISASNTCNGLICLTFAQAQDENDAIYICNPLSKQTILVKCIHDMPEKSVHRCALGFVHATNTYKVVHISYDTSLEDYATNGKVEVLTLGRANSWRELNVRTPGFLDKPPVLAADGVLHWASNDAGNHNGQRHLGRIISFDVTNEVFDTTNISHMLSFNNFQLAVFKGRLAAFDLSTNGCVGVWFLDGERSRWFAKCESILLTVPFHQSNIGNTKILGMCWYCEDEIILFRNSGKLHSYSMTTHQIRHVHAPDDVDLDGLELVCFSGSPLSPFRLR